MKKWFYILPALLLVIILIIGLFLKSQSVNNSKQATKQILPLPKEVLVKLDKNGFSPKEVTIKAGTAVRWKNVSGEEQTVNSDDYPTNQKHKELNFGVFNSGSSFIYVFRETGTYAYHNQFNSKQAGKIIVIK